MQLDEHIPLAPYTTFKIGGPAAYFARVATIDELKEALLFAKEQTLATFFLGGGSNVLISDSGFDGLVIKNEFMGVEDNNGLVVAGAGESWDALVACAIERNEWGIENLSGIPGTVGGAVVQNIGAYGQVLSQTLEWVEAYDTATDELKRISKEEYQSGYRTSVFQQHKERYMVLRVALKLSPGGGPAISYKDLAARFEGKHPTLAEVRAAVLEIRASKFPDLTQEGSAGSFFKNPILEVSDAEALQQKYPTMPVFTMPEVSGVKVPLAWILDHALSMRGTEVGGARLYEKQPLVIAAKKGATSEDIKKLAALVQEKIRTTLNIHIEPEVRII